MSLWERGRRGESLRRPIARSLGATVAATAIVLGAWPAIASPTAQVSGTPAAVTSPSPTTDPSPSPTSEVTDDPAPSTAPSPKVTDDASSAPSGPSDVPTADPRERDRALGRELGQAGAFASVAARDNRFVPVSITVEAGTTVVWDNEGQAPHTVTANDRAFDSGTLDPGQRFQIAFDQVGTVPYYCQIHGEPGSGMTGVVRVIAAVGGPDEGGDPSTAPVALPRTGSGTVPLALLALGLAVAGSLALRAGVRRERR
jgi:plastocyanin